MNEVFQLPHVPPGGDALTVGLSLLLKATAILVVAWTVAACLRRRAAGLRHVVWTLSFAAILGLPLISAWMPPLEVDLSRVEPIVEQISSRVLADRTALSGPSLTTPEPEGDGAAAMVETPVALEDVEEGAQAPVPARGNAPLVVMLIWGGGAALLTFILGHHLARIRRVTRKAVPKHRIGEVASHVAGELGVARPPRVLVGQVDMPVTWGLFNPVVLLPVDAIDWDRRRLELVLKHEFAHIRRRDYLPHLIAELACIFYWPNPLVWVARRRLRTEQELACDDVVLRSGTPSHDYAELLLDVARSVQGRSLLPGGIRMAERKGLKHRIRSILDPEVDRGTVSVHTLVAVVLAIAVPALSTAALSSEPRANSVEAESAAETTAPVEPVPEADRSVVVEQDSTAARDAAPASAFTLTVEAEKGRLTAPMSLHDDDDASGGRFVMVPDQKGHDPPEGGPGRASFEIDLKDVGARAVWARVIGEHRNDNSFFVSVDERNEFRWDIRKHDGDDVDDWTWLRVVDPSGSPLRIETGVHTLSFRNREDGSRLDAVFLSSDPVLVPRGRSPLPPPETSVSVSIEAEEPSDILAPLEIRNDDDASGRLYVAVARGHDSRRRPPEDGRAAYEVDVPVAGRYVVWARAEERGGDSDSFWIRVNDGGWVRWNDIDGDDWTWQLVHDSDDDDEPSVFELQAGSNTVEIAYREDGARLDRLVVTNNMYVHPSAREASASGVTVTFRD